MRQIWTTRVGESDVLEVRESEDPHPRAKEVRIQVKGIGINFADILIRKGAYPNGPTLPAVVGYEVSGLIDELGDQTHGYQLGDRVMAYSRFGAYADRVCIPMEQCYIVPEKMGFYEACALPVNGNTAFALLHEMARMRKDETVLIYAAAGGVGTCACQIAHILGVEVIGIASRSKHSFLMDFGIHKLIDLKEDSLEDKVQAFTKGRGVDVILDSYGGDYWVRNQKLLKPMGKLIVFGYSSTVEKALGRTKLPIQPWEVGNPLMLMQSNSAVMGVDLSKLWDHPLQIRNWTQQLLKWYDVGKLQPVIDKVFEFELAGTAQRFVEERKNKGKVVLKVGD